VTPGRRAGLGGAAALDALADAMGAAARRDAPLGARTTYRVGGRAALEVTVEEEADLVRLHGALAGVGAPVPLLVLGEGSNLLVADAGFQGVVVSLGPGFAAESVTASTIRAGGRSKLPVVARKSVAAGLRGLEWAVGVPGSVGGALRMNAGGHGSDTAAVLARCTVFDLESGRTADWGPARLAFGYRRSALGPAHVVLWAEFSLESGDREAGERVLADIVRWRRANQPGGANSGSVFVNPEGDSAGRLIEAAGLKGLRIGSAQVSEKHANFVQADPADAGGRADDVWRLVEHVRSAVAARTGVRLVTEVRMVGFDDEPPMVHSRPTPSTSTGGRG